MYKGASYERGGEDKSGVLNEHFLFGDITSGRNSQRYLDELSSALKARTVSGGKSTYLGYEEAMRLAIRSQVDTPEQPKRLFMKDLRLAIEGVFKIAFHGKQFSVKIYSAIGTPLDIYHGVDAFVEIEDEMKKRTTITFDVTLDELKKMTDGMKADVMIGILPDPQDEEKQYRSTLQHIANDVLVQYRARVGR